jgi:hypothetical protein
MYVERLAIGVRSKQEEIWLHAMIHKIYHPVLCSKRQLYS